MTTTFRMLESNELDDFIEKNRAMATEHKKAIKKGHCDLCPYDDIVKAWKKNYKKVVTDIVPIVGKADWGEVYTNVVYAVKTKDGEMAFTFANRSTMSGVEYATMRLGQAVIAIEKMKKRKELENADND